ncbi:MAG: tetratricopeptide repeat protein [Nitrospinaceae bacterium]
MAASKRAQEIFEDLAGSNPDAFLPDLARSLNNLGTRYFAMRRHGQALTAAQRANEIYEDLARSNPDAYLPDLAQSFMTLGFVHQEVRHWGEAQRCFYQGIVKLKEPFLQYPSAFSGFMDGLIGDYAAFCETIEKTPDMELIGPLLKKLEQLKLLEAPEEE